MDDKRSLGERISEGMRFMWSRRKRAKRLWDKLPERLQDILTARGVTADDLLDSSIVRIPSFHARWRNIQAIPGVGPVYAQKIMEADDD